MKDHGTPLRVSSATAVSSMPASAAAAPSHGDAWPDLERQADALVESVMEKNDLPGLTVAVTKQGRLVLAKGYGLADTASKTGMRRDTRVRIGSVTKATITGPAGFQLMKAKRIDPQTKKLYGAADSVFFVGFDADAIVGARRHNPIIAIAIAPDDRVYAWYCDGTRSVGTSSDLAAHEKPTKFTLPPGKTLLDLQAIAISKDSRVYCWYLDATLSIGSSTELGKHRAPGEAREVKVPGGKSMDHLVGAAISKTSDHGYYFFEDGTLTSGTSTDMGAYFSGRRYKSGGAGAPWEMVDAGIAADDHVFAWFNHTGFGGQFSASSGTSTDLDRYRTAYDYTVPETKGPDWRAWYREITIQHLLDHSAGFSRDGDQDGARAMFKVSEADLTYRQVHQHFLRTKKLLFRPGTGVSYSNHGFGLWTLIIEALSGKPYASYVRDDYLAPMGLEDEVLPMSSRKRSSDATGYRFSGGKLQAVPFKDSGLGLAAGGFMASGESLVRIMRSLDETYTDEQLDDMGWGKEFRADGKGKLSHNGKLDGGTAFAVMFPRGYVSVSGKKLGRVHVAIATNVSTDAGALDTLASQIALAVPDAKIPDEFDLWK
jgi:CubicO group peptidase (beta-lactamase class C family)